MAGRSVATLLRHLRHRTNPAADGRSDGQLLGFFAACRDEAAFEALLERHGPMVLRLCRSLLGNPHDAEDAFQATYLVLACKASTIRKQPSVASWLYGVARRIALRARDHAARRREEPLDQAEPTQPSTDNADLQELRWLLTEELQRLPEKYRAPLVLCYLEGKTNQAAARELGWPSGSMSTRLARGRELLRERLTARGLAVPSGLLAPLTAGTASAAMPASLLHTTLRSVTLFKAGAAASASTPVVLAQGILRAMFTAKLKVLAPVLLLIALTAGAVARFTYPGHTAERTDPPTISLPADPHAVVLLYDIRRPDPPRQMEGSRLRLTADGTVTTLDSYGTGRSATAHLSTDEVQRLLRFVLREHRFTDLDSGALEKKGRSEAATVVLRVQADGRQHELRCPDPAHLDPQTLEASHLRAIGERLEKLVGWTYAGGREGVAAALKHANRQVSRDFPQAPRLTTDDFQSAMPHRDGATEVVFERRGVAPDRNPYSFVFARLEVPTGGEPRVTVKASLATAAASASEKLPKGPIDCVPRPITGDRTVKYDFDIVYVRLPRQTKYPYFWAEINPIHRMPAGGDLMLLHPDGREELLVAGGEDGTIQDSMPSFDAQWVYYAHFHGLKKADTFFPSPEGADIYKVHVKTRKIVRLTDQTFTPNTGAANWSADFRTREKGKNFLHYGVLNCGPCPLPGGKIVFTSNRNAHVPPRGGPNGSTLQLFVMDDDGKNVEQIGHLNLGEALHPVVLKDGRIMFSNLENQGMRGNLQWGLWSIHPDGSSWGPIISAFYTDSFHFQTQLSDGSIVAQLYYNVSNLSAGTYYKLPPRGPEGMPGFYPADISRTPSMRYLPWVPSPLSRMSFQPYGMETLTRFATDFDVAAVPDRPGQDREKYTGRRMGKVTHPGAAPDNHLLTVWSGGRVKWDDTNFDSGIYLIKGGKPVNGPGEMLLIKNDPKYNEQWPKALVPYQRIYGIPEPKTLPVLRNDGKLSPHLPEGTPFGLVGTSSLYKRESAPFGAVRGKGVTAITEDHWLLDGRNWATAGADAGRYENSDIWGIRIVTQEPTTDQQGESPRRHYFNHAKSERMRILGEIPVRKFSRDPKGSEPLDPDSNPDTSFLAKIPANMAWTFQTIDKNGMVLNMAQTWHQIRPGEIRNDCGGCHAHSQKPTEFKLTAAAKSDYIPFDLTQRAPLLTSRKLDQSGKRWDAGNQTGLRYAKGGVVSIEFYRDIQPILKRSCAACHTKSWEKPAGNLVLDDNQPLSAHNRMAGTYVRLALQNDEGIGSAPVRFGHKPPRGEVHWGSPTRASRYVWKLQSRRSLLAWKLFGKRLDGFRDDDFTTEAVPGDNTTLHHKGRAVDAKTWKYKDDPRRQAPPFSVGYHGSVMPPPRAVAGIYVAPNGKKIKVAPLSDEDRLTLVRWIDLGCPIDLDYNPSHPERRGYGFACDDQRPTLTLTYPQPGINPPLTRLLMGMHDYYSGLDMRSFQVVADFPLDGQAPGQNLAAKFRPKTDGVWELNLSRPITRLTKGKLTISVKDRQGNITKIERSFAVTASRSVRR